MATKEEEQRRKWHVDHSIPLALVGAIAFQTLVGTWWMSSFESRTVTRLDTLEKRQVVLDAFPERMAKQEAQLEAVLSAMRGVRDDVRELSNRGARK